MRLSTPLFPAFLVLMSLSAALFTPAAAQNDEQIACLLRPKAEGVALRDLTIFDTALQAALKGRQILPVSAKERDILVEQEGLTGCYHDTCLDRIGRLLRVQRVVAYRVIAEAALAPAPALRGDFEPPPAGEHWRSFTLSLSYYNVEIGAVGARLEGACPSCSTHQAVQQLLALLKQAIAEDASHPRGQLEIDTMPPGAAIFIDGIEVGTAPYHRAAFIGPHEITARKSGFRAKLAVLPVQADTPARLSFTMEPGRDTPRTTLLLEHQPRPRWRLGVGSALLGLGLFGIGFGIYGFAVDGQCVAPPVPPSEVCPDIVQGRPAGIGFTVSGSVVAGVGLLFLALPGPRNKLPTNESERDTFSAPAGAP